MISFTQLHFVLFWPERFLGASTASTAIYKESGQQKKLLKAKMCKSFKTNAIWLSAADTFIAEKTTSEM